MVADRRRLSVARRQYPRAVGAEVLAYGTVVRVMVSMGPGLDRAIQVPVREFMFWMDRRGIG